jgi:hypothetical protein
MKVCVTRSVPVLDISAWTRMHAVETSPSGAFCNAWWATTTTTAGLGSPSWPVTRPSRNNCSTSANCSEESDLKSALPASSSPALESVADCNSLMYAATRSARPAGLSAGAETRHSSTSTVRTASSRCSRAIPVVGAPTSRLISVLPKPFDGGSVCVCQTRLAATAERRTQHQPATECEGARPPLDDKSCRGRVWMSVKHPRHDTREGFKHMVIQLRHLRQQSRRQAGRMISKCAPSTCKTPTSDCPTRLRPPLGSSAQAGQPEQQGCHRA